MANLSQEIKDRLLANSNGTVAILAHRLSAAGNVNVMFGEVEESKGSDNGAFNVFMETEPLKKIKYAWQVMKPEIAEKMYDITGSQDEITENYIQDPTANGMYIKIQQTESLKGDDRDLLVNPSTGEVVLHESGAVIYRTSKITLQADKNYQHRTVKLPRFEGEAVSTETPFSVDSL